MYCIWKIIKRKRSGKAKLHLNEYLDFRKNSNETLFVCLKYPYNRLGIGLVELIIKTIGKSNIHINLEEHVLLK